MHHSLTTEEGQEQLLKEGRYEDVIADTLTCR